jgi:hypothetical protein
VCRDAPWGNQVLCGVFHGAGAQTNTAMPPDSPGLDLGSAASKQYPHSVIPGEGGHVGMALTPAQAVSTHLVGLSRARLHRRACRARVLQTDGSLPGPIPRA